MGKESIIGRLNLVQFLWKGQSEDKNYIDVTWATEENLLTLPMG